MDTENLFNPAGKREKITKEESKDIWIDTSLAYTPLTFGLLLEKDTGRLPVKQGTLAENADKLREGECDISLIPSLAYAHKKETWQIVPDICLSANRQARHVQLYFNKGLTRISRIILPTEMSTEVALLKILMQEKFQLTPQYEVHSGSLDDMLLKGDAVLVVGDQSLDYFIYHRNRLDLNEEWADMTGLPFVYAFWAGREMTVSQKDLLPIVDSFNLGSKNLDKIAKNYASNHAEDWVFYHDFLLKDLSYSFDETQKDALNEFYQYAFFYGYTEFIPELHFFNI